MAGYPEVHVGDVGTKYWYEIQDEEGPFDPTDATIKRLIFKMAGGRTIARTATVETLDSPPSRWYLTYTVVTADVEVSPYDFHGDTGTLKLQVYLEYEDGNKFSATVETEDTQGRQMKVARNLVAEAVAA